MLELADSAAADISLTDVLEVSDDEADSAAVPATFTTVVVDALV